jgi:hypothetical protein
MLWGIFVQVTEFSKVTNVPSILILKLLEKYPDYQKKKKKKKTPGKRGKNLKIDCIRYVNNYNTSIAIMTECMENPKFSAFIEKMRSASECNGLSFASFLIQPIQRLPVRTPFAPRTRIPAHAYMHVPTHSHTSPHPHLTPPHLTLLHSHFTSLTYNAFL